MHDWRKLVAFFLVILMVSSLVPVINAISSHKANQELTSDSKVSMRSYTINENHGNLIHSSLYYGSINFNLSDYNVVNYSTQLSSFLDWTSQEVYFRGNFYIVGGSGLISLNGSIGNYNMVKENSPKGGYCRYVTPDNGSLILGGNYFDPPAGLYIYSYNPVNNSLENISARLPQSVTEYGSEHNIGGMQRFANFTYIIYDQQRNTSRLYIQKFNSKTTENISSQIMINGYDVATASGGGYMIMIGGQGTLEYSYLLNESGGISRILNGKGIANSVGIDCVNEVAYVGGDFMLGDSGKIYQYNPSTNQTELLKSYNNSQITFVSSGPSNSTMFGVYNDSYTNLIILKNGTFHSMGSYYGIINDAAFSNESGSILMIGESLLPGKAVSYYLQNKYTEVYFEESGLPSGMQWTIHLSGSSFNQNLSTVSNETDVLLPYGNYTLRATSYSRTYYAISETIDVDYQGVVVHIDFLPYNYNVTFTESGLPSNLSWDLHIVSINNTFPNYTVNGSMYTVHLQNGTYTYYINSSSKSWFTFNSTGKFKVNGSNENVSILFIRSYLVEFKITFPYVLHEWFINGSLGTKYHFNLSGNSNFTETYLPNGTYIYHGSTTQKKYYNKGGNFTVEGRQISVNVSFIPYLYNVTIVKNTTENTGEWGFYVNNTTIYENNNSNLLLKFRATNGSYNIRFFNMNNDYRPKIDETTLIVNGSPVVFDLNFVKSFYVIFSSKEVLHEKWTVDLTNSSGFCESGNFSGRNVTFILGNGTYHYNVIYDGYHLILSPGSGSINVQGRNVIVNLTPELAYNVNFSETDLLNGTEWYLNVTSSSGLFYGTSNISYIDLCLPEGNFTYYATSRNKIFESQQGSGMVTGINSSMAIVFGISTYRVVFTLNNLPGMDFFMNITEIPVTYRLLRGTFSNLSREEGSGAYILYLVNGTYKLNAHILNRTYTLNGFSFVVEGNSVEYKLNLQPYLYQVQFILDSDGVSGYWSVNGINGPTSSGIDIYQINGTHNYTIEGPVSVFVKNSTGKFTINGKNLTIKVSFIRKNDIQIVETYGLNYLYQAFNTIQDSYLNLFAVVVAGLAAYSSYNAFSSIRKLTKRN